MPFPPRPLPKHPPLERPAARPAVHNGHRAPRPGAPPHRHHARPRRGWLDRFGAFVVSLLLCLSVASAVFVAQRAPVPHEPRAAQVTATDRDGDGLDDALEDLLLARYAPNVLVAADDPSKPASIEWIRERASLEMDGPSHMGIVVPGRAFDARTRAGSSDPKDWTVYGHAYRREGGGVALQYWFYFPFNEAPFFLFNHDGDWEHLTVELGPSLLPESVAFARHGHNAPGVRVPWADVPKDGDHPWAISAWGTHATYMAGHEAPFWEKVVDCARDADGAPVLEGCPVLAWKAGEGPGRSSPIVNVGERGAPREGSEAADFFISYPGLWGGAAVILGGGAPAGPPFQRSFCADAAEGGCP